ncbi:MAG TPA: hypothetical protein PLB96_01405 [Syntrophales bacterium]|nr:hypothetical protein [Syntrophales bacterium]
MSCLEELHVQREEFFACLVACSAEDILQQQSENIPSFRFLYPCDTSPEDHVFGFLIDPVDLKIVVHEVSRHRQFLKRQLKFIPVFPDIFGGSACPGIFTRNGKGFSVGEGREGKIRRRRRDRRFKRSFLILGGDDRSFLQNRSYLLHGHPFFFQILYAVDRRQHFDREETNPSNIAPALRSFDGRPRQETHADIVVKGRSGNAAPLHQVNAVYPVQGSLRKEDGTISIHN